MKATEITTIAIASFSLVVSVLTAWLTLFRRGEVRMTRPNIVGFAYDGATPKIFLRFLLYSTARRGNIIESMHVTFLQGGKRTLFSFWGYGDDQKSLVRGSGLFVSQEGLRSIIISFPQEIIKAGQRRMHYQHLRFDSGLQAGRFALQHTSPHRRTGIGHIIRRKGARGYL